MKIDTPTSTFLQNFFDKIFVITLERAKDRQIQVSKQLEGLPFEFYFGVDKQQLNQEQINKDNIYDETNAKKFQRHGKGMLLGEIACALSHRKLYEHILNKGYNRVMIFEDDVVTLTENIYHLPDAITELPPDWDMVYFGYEKYEKATFKLKCKQLFYRLENILHILKWSQFMISNLLPRPFSKHLQKAGFHDLLHSYAVTNKACKKLIDHQNPVVFNSDSLISYMILNGRLNAFSTTSQFFTQEKFLDPSYRSYIHH